MSREWFFQIPARKMRMGERRAGRSGGLGARSERFINSIFYAARPGRMKKTVRSTAASIEGIQIQKGPTGISQRTIAQCRKTHLPVISAQNPAKRQAFQSNGFGERIVRTLTDSTNRREVPASPLPVLNWVDLDSIFLDARCGDRSKLQAGMRKKAIRTRRGDLGKQSIRNCRLLPGTGVPKKAVATVASAFGR